MVHLTSMNQQKLASSGSREAVPEEIKMSPADLSRQWVSCSRSCKLLEVGAQG